MHERNRLADFGIDLMTPTVRPGKSTKDSLELSVRSFLEERSEKDPRLEIARSFLDSVVKAIAERDSIEARTTKREMGRLQTELSCLKEKVCDIEKLLEIEEIADKELEVEISGIAMSPFNPLSLNDTDWLPTGSELDDLLDDD